MENTVDTPQSARMIIFLHKKDVLARLHVNQATLYRWINEGILPPRLCANRREDIDLARDT